MSHRQVVAVLYAVCGVGAAFSLLVTVPGNNFAGLLLVTFCLVVWGGVRLLGYSELDLAQQMVMTGVFRQVLGARLFVKSIEERCARALSADDYWAVVQDVAAELKCVHVRMSLLGAEYERCAESGQPGACFSIQIPLSAGDYVSFRYPAAQPMRQAIAMASIVEILQGAVTLKTGTAHAVSVVTTAPVARDAAEGTSESDVDVVRVPEPACG